MKPIACISEVYRLEPDDLVLESFRVALQTNSAEDILNMIPADASIDGVYRRNPPSLYEHAVVLHYFGLHTVMEKLVKYLEPVVKAYFGCDGEIDSHFSFSVTFGLEDLEHRSIDPNYGDDSDITIKLCLKDLDSTGAQLVFGGRKCVEHETMQEEEPPLQEMEVNMGQAVMHCGCHRNGFTPIQQYSKEYLNHLV
ncbi:hypothetical protein POM88_034353 [Heracleum sosnowskyi]|uniref:Uncharacterized protein n=1 Tax=Heracleum sosnowskyi TaxID=360622 RepID=A0AAD8HKE4_9APIA|nr:hypothetical protein POM88_034353 [Heracleum sosnowskyi]